MDDEREWGRHLASEMRKMNAYCKAMKGKNYGYITNDDPFLKYKHQSDNAIQLFRDGSGFVYDFLKTDGCKPISQVSNSISSDGRYYKHAYNKEQCDHLKGQWDQTAVNRQNKISKGVCWTNDNNSFCAAQIDPIVLGSRNEHIVDANKSKCDAAPNGICKWSGRDCVPNDESVKKVDVAPSDGIPGAMPFDMRMGMERFLYKWYNLDGIDEYKTAFNAKAPHTFSIFPKNGETNRCLSKLSNSDIIDPSNMAPSIVQSIVNVTMKNMAKYPDSTNRGLLAWHSTGSGKTCTATGVIAAYWDGVSKLNLGGGVTTTIPKDIIFASSLSGLAANSEKAFAMCARRFYDKFKTPEFAPPATGTDEYRANFVIDKIVAAMQERNVRFLSFAKLSNRIEKTEAYKAQGQYPLWYNPMRGGRVRKDKKKQKGIAKPEPKAKYQTKAKAKPRSKYEDEDEEEEDYAPVKQKSRNMTKNKGDERRRAPSFISISKNDWVDLDNTVLIIDEVQDIFKPIATQAAEYEKLRKHLTTLEWHPKLKVVILTATPGDSVEDVLNLVNMVRHVDSPPIAPPKNYDDKNEVDRFTNSVRGLVSFLDMSHDTTKFPIVEDPRKPTEYIMSSKQFDEYAEAYLEIMNYKGDSKKDPRNWEKLAAQNKVDKYWEKARKFANSLSKFEQDSGIFSSKLPALVEKIKEFPSDKHYVYSSFAVRGRGTKVGIHGIYTVSDALKSMGYQQLDVAQAKKVAEGKVTLKPGKRFILVTQKELGADAASSKSNKAQMQVALNLKYLVDVYNKKENKHGELVHVMLASEGYNQGVDLQAVRHIHIFEPLLKLLSDKQTIGRAARHCSHADLDAKNGEWSVKIHRYAMGLPDMQMPVPISSEKGRGRKKHVDLSVVENIDMKIYQEAKTRGKELFLLYTLIQQAAIDCQVLQKFHKQNEEAYGHLKCHRFRSSEKEKEIREQTKRQKEIELQKQQEDLQKQIQYVIDENNKRQQMQLEIEAQKMGKQLSRMTKRRETAERELKEKLLREEEERKERQRIEEARKKEEMRLAAERQRKEEARKQEEMRLAAERKAKAFKEMQVLKNQSSTKQAELSKIQDQIIDIKSSITGFDNDIQRLQKMYKNNILINGGRLKYNEYLAHVRDLDNAKYKVTELAKKETELKRSISDIELQMGAHRSKYSDVYRLNR